MNWGVLLAGGSGTRFWPLSTPSRPKQLLPLAGPVSTAQAAVERLEGLIPPERLLVVTGRQLAGPLQESLGLPPENILVEPKAASTAPALFWATMEAERRDPEASVLSMHADWWIGDPAGFRRTAAHALETGRRHDRLVTVGIVPSRPETGYGYIVRGRPLDGDATEVQRFQEKPDAATALDLLASGALWNSGLFAWTASRLAAEIAEHTPELAPHAARLRAGDVPGFFEAVTPVSIDVGVLERSRRVAVVPGDFQWDDVGTWDALGRVRERDPLGNVVQGDVSALETRDCIAWSESMPLVLFGVEDLIVVEANGRVLVTRRERATDLKRLLDAIPAAVRDLR
ncbi:MAG TPA: sugar phosphate nucleotidyltransferase [Gemmatimonadales bacterium]|nr:sugar phosphate nucleotidyltransferase [Gemmatimonadales bacterium]